MWWTYLCDRCSTPLHLQSQPAPSLQAVDLNSSESTQWEGKWWMECMECWCRCRSTHVHESLHNSCCVGVVEQQYIYLEEKIPVQIQDTTFKYNSVNLWWKNPRLTNFFSLDTFQKKINETPRRKKRKHISINKSVILLSFLIHISLLGDLSTTKTRTVSGFRTTKHSIKWLALNARVTCGDTEHCLDEVMKQRSVSEYLSLDWCFVVVWSVLGCWGSERGVEAQRWDAGLQATEAVRDVGRARWLSYRGDCKDKTNLKFATKEKPQKCIKFFF